jgi:hypothetical protein
VADPDLTRPTLLSLDLPRSIDVTRGETQVVFAARAADVGAGVDQVRIVLDRSFQGDSGLENSITLFDGADSFADGGSAMSKAFRPATGAGTYAVSGVFVQDKAGNSAFYDRAELRTLGLRTSFEVVSTTPADLAPPRLLGLDLPQVVTLHGGDAAVSFTARASDQGMGVDYVRVILDRSFQGPLGLENGLSIYDSADSFADGSASIMRTFGAATGAGAYSVAGVIVGDRAGNVSSYGPTELAALGIRTTFEVMSPTPADLTAPVLTGLTLPASVDISSGDVLAAFAVQAADNGGAGVSQVRIVLDRTFQGGFGPEAGVTLYDAADAFSDGASATTRLIRATTGWGTYNVAAVFVDDKAGNTASYDTAELQALGLRTTFQITDGSAPGAAVGLAGGSITASESAGVLNVPVDLPGAGTFALSLQAEITGPAGLSNVRHQVVLQSAGVGQVLVPIPTPQDSFAGDATAKVTLSRTDGGTWDPGRSVLHGRIVDDDRAGFSINTSDLGASYRNIMRVPAPTAFAVDTAQAQGARHDIGRLADLAVSTTSVAVLAYEFFTGRAPTSGGLDYLVNPAVNPNSLNSAYYAVFNQENRYINFASNLGLHGEGAGAFAATYGPLSFHDALVSAYDRIIGYSDPAAIAGIEQSRPYFEQVARERMPAENLDLATKTAAIGYLLQEAAKADIGVYARSLENFYLDLSDGSIRDGVSLVGVYGPGSVMDVVG